MQNQAKVQTRQDRFNLHREGRLLLLIHNFPPVTHKDQYFGYARQHSHFGTRGEIPELTSLGRTICTVRDSLSLPLTLPSPRSASAAHSLRMVSSTQMATACNSPATISIEACLFITYAPEGRDKIRTTKPILADKVEIFTVFVC